MNRIKIVIIIVFFLLLANLGERLAAAESQKEEVDLGGQNKQEIKNYSERADVQSFIDFMVERHNFAKDDLLLLFEKIPVRKKETEKQVKRTQPRRQAPEDWLNYRKRFVTESRVKEGLIFARKYMKFLRAVSKKNRVPLKIMVATVGMETYYGKNTGRFRVFRNLLISAFDGARRSSFYKRELEFFLLLCRRNGYDPLVVKGSYSGALGLAQFIPSSILKLGVDGDGDAKVDLLNNPYDALASIGHYYKACGWQAYKPVANKLRNLPSRLSAKNKEKILTVQAENGELEYWRLYKNFSILKCYNNSKFYALALYQLSEAIEKEALGY